jgi:hypothetical protein
MELPALGAAAGGRGGLALSFNQFAQPVLPAEWALLKRQQGPQQAVIVERCWFKARFERGVGVAPFRQKVATLQQGSDLGRCLLKAGLGLQHQGVDLIGVGDGDRIGDPVRSDGHGWFSWR